MQIVFILSVGGIRNKCDRFTLKTIHYVGKPSTRPLLCLLLFRVSSLNNATAEMAVASSYSLCRDPHRSLLLFIIISWRYSSPRQNTEWIKDDENDDDDDDGGGFWPRTFPF